MTKEGQLTNLLKLCINLFLHSYLLNANYVPGTVLVIDDGDQNRRSLKSYGANNLSGGRRLLLKHR